VPTPSRLNASFERTEVPVSPIRLPASALLLAGRLRFSLASTGRI
jgi:hypothetical protein